MNCIGDKLTLETEFVVLGRTLSLKTGVHWDAKKALKWFAFSVKFDMSLLLTMMGEWVGFSFHHIVFKIDQHALVFGSLSLYESWQW